MNKKTGANLFKGITKWPLIPPWWLISAPQAAALLGATSATLHNWRIRGEGPEVVPPMYLRRTQGDPIYYMYGNVRSWAAQRVGLDYAVNDQCEDFYEEVLPQFSGGEGSWRGKAKTFEMLFEEAHKQVRIGKGSGYFALEKVQQMDLYYSKQPRQLQPILSIRRRDEIEA